MDLLTPLAHAGHPVYDHPAVAAIGLAALIIPWVVLFFVGRIFLRSSRDRDGAEPKR